MAHYLRQHNACCIAGFGIFRLDKVSSHIDPIAQKFQPMELIPIFTQGNFESSINFISYCGSVWGLSFNEANQKVSLQLELANHELLNNGKLSIDELGFFTQGLNGKIQFEFAKDKWTTASSFGLTAIRFIQETQKPKKLLVDRTAKPGEHEDIEETRENALRELKQMLEDAGVDNSVANEPKAPKSKVFPVLATVLTLILIVNVVLFLQKNPKAANNSEIAKMNMAELPANIDTEEVTELSENVQLNTTNTSNKSTNNQLFNPGFALSKGAFEFDSSNYFNNLNLLNLVSQDEVLSQTNLNRNLVNPDKSIADLQINEPSDSKETFKEVKTNTLNNNTLKKEQVTRDVKTTQPENSFFYIIVGAFGNHENAVKLQESYKNKGYESSQLLPANKKGMTLVAIQQLANEEEANDLKATYESQGIDCWIFQRN